MSFKMKHLLSLGLLSGLTLFSTTVFAANLKQPYILYQMPNTTMTVLWQDTAVETNTLSWGTDLSYGAGTAQVGEETRPGTVNQHQYKITGLQPNTRYYYKVEATAGGTVYGTGSFLTAPDESATSVRFIGQGDSRSQPFALNNLMKAVTGFTSLPGNDDYSRLAIANGDWVNSDADSNWVTEWFDNAKTDIRSYVASTPMDGCKGNHDNSSGYTTYFTKYYPNPYPTSAGAMTLKATTTATYNNLFWSLDYGPVHVIYLDSYSSYAPGSAQYNWLVSDLAATTKQWKVVVWHDSDYSAGSDGDNTGIRALEPIFAANGVDLTWHGHSHNYARAGAYTLAQAGGDSIALNVPHITSGGGGAPIYQPDLSNNGNYPHVITGWPSYEFMTFDVNGKDLTMTAYQVTNESTTAIVPLSASFPASDGTSNLFLEKIEATVLHHYTNVSNQVTATPGPLVYNRATKLYTGNLTVTNNGASDLTGNVDVVLDGMFYMQGVGAPSNMYSTASPKISSMIASRPASSKGNTDPGLLTGVTLTNATGSNNGEPMIRVSTSGIPAGATVTVPISFSNPSSAKISFNPITYQE